MTALSKGGVSPGLKNHIRRIFPSLSWYTAGSIPSPIALVYCRNVVAKSPSTVTGATRQELAEVAHSSLLPQGPVFVIVSTVIVYAIIDLRSSSDHPLGDAVETFLRREDAERFIEDVRRDEPELADSLRIEERELDAGREN